MGRVLVTAYFVVLFGLFATWAVLFFGRVIYPHLTLSIH